MRIADAIKREQRGCDRDVPKGTYAFDPDLTRCPKTLLTPRVSEVVGWWDEWRRYGVLPFGGRSLDDEPAVVFDAIDLCQRTYDAAMAEKV